MQTQELVTIIPWTFIAQILNLFIQVWLIKRFLFRPVDEIISKRKAEADSEIEKARTAAAEAEAVKAEYEGNMREARSKAESLLSEAGRTAAERSEAIIDEAKKEADAIRKNARDSIELEKKKAIGEIRAEIGDMAVDIAGKVIERELSEKDHKKLIDDFIRNVGEKDE